MADASAPANPAASSSGPPRPMPFAIMRNAHEALRANIRPMERHLEGADIVRFGEEWHTPQRWPCTWR
jgi:hypothetical protein